MAPVISIVCQEGGHATALAYAKLLSGAGLPILVNFPSTERYPLADQASQLINERTGAVLVIVSADVFPGSGRNPRFRIDTEVIHALLSISTTAARSRIYPVVIDDASEAKIKATWLSNLSWVRDSAIVREQILNGLRQMASSDEFGGEISSFNNAASIISAVETGCEIERIAHERVPAENIGYEIFRCTRPVWNEVLYYIHLHRGITISNTVKHFRHTHPEVYQSSNKVIVLSMERGQVRPQERLGNIQISFECPRVRYLEDIVSTMISRTLDTPIPAHTHMALRKFVEPQVKYGLGTDNPPSEYAKIVEWLGGPRSGVLVLVGQGGIGKTWAMMNLRQLVTSAKVRFTKPITRNVIFISSTDIARTYGRSLVNTQDITLYDLYCASRDFDLRDNSVSHRLDRETFYNALELGSLVVFVDGLDEVITRHRGRFNATAFFTDLNERFVGDSDGKVIVSCRNIFFDQDEFRISFPYIETYELLAFDEERRDTFFLDGLAAMPNRRAKATELSNQIARLPDGRYVPFVLDLVKEIIVEQADNALDFDIDRFQSSLLHKTNVNDRIVGQFCHREMVKVADPVGQLSVDEQVNVFCGIARTSEASKGRVDKGALARIMVSCLGKRGVGLHVEHFLAHPFVSQEAFRRSGFIDFRFDFMPEYFLMLDTYRRIQADAPVDDDDIRILNKFCSINSPFCQGIIERLSTDPGELRLRLLRMNEQAWEVVGDRRRFPEEDTNILDPDSAIAHFSFALVSLLATFEARNGAVDTGSFTDGLIEVFGRPGSISKMALLDGFVREEERLRVDFRGIVSEQCLFHSFDFWNCEFDDNSVFGRCRFMNCSGAYSRSSGVNNATFRPDCQYDDEFERIFASGSQKLRNSEAQNIDAVRSFVSDFYRQGGFRRVGLENLERFYGHSNSVIPFKKLYRAMRRHNVVEEEDRGHYLEVSITRGASASAECLITQGVITGVLKKVALDLR